MSTACLLHVVLSARVAITACLLPARVDALKLWAAALGGSRYDH